MILGIGIDSVEIERFVPWHTKNHRQLQRIFSEQEIEYCLSNPELSAQRFAVRFAAREALFKAISVQWPDHTIPFLTLCRVTTIVRKRAPEMLISWNMLKSFGIFSVNTRMHLSMTHTHQTATAIVLVETL